MLTTGLRLRPATAAVPRIVIVCPRAQQSPMPHVTSLGRGARFRCVGLACSITWFGVARAQASGHALEVEALPGCADRAQLIQAIRSRIPEFEPVAWQEPGAIRITVRFSQRQQDVLVELDTHDPDAGTSTRSIPARDCAEGLRASAWILSLFFDSRKQGKLDEQPSAPPPEAPEVRPTVAREPSRGQASQKRQPPRARTTDVPLAEREPWYVGVGAFGGWLTTGLPQLPLGFGVFAEVGWQGDSWFAPSLRLAGVDAGTSSGHTDRGDVEVSLALGRLGLCPLRTPHELANLRVCVLGELGRLSGEGQNTLGQSTQTATWYAAGLALGLELHVLSRLVLELEGASLFPINRDRFVFEPEPVHVGYEVPAASASVSVGASFRF